MKRISVILWNILFVSLLAIFFWFGLIAFLAFREKITITDNAPGTFSHSPYGMQGKGYLLTRIPTRVLLIEISRFGHVDTYGRTCLAQLPMTPDELKSDIALWKSDTALSFQRFDVSNESRPDYWPDWFPATTPYNYIGTVKTSHGWTIGVFRSTGDNEHVYLVY
jgi:hypothetical protein